MKKNAKKFACVNNIVYICSGNKKKTAPGRMPGNFKKTKDMNNLFTTISAIAAANPAGFTYNVEQNQMQATGYAVALQCTQNSFGVDGLENVISVVTSGISGASCVGGWMDTETGLYYYQE